MCLYNIDERTNKDKATVNEVFNVLNVETDVIEVRRLGKPNKNRSRLLRVSLPSICKKTGSVAKIKVAEKLQFPEHFYPARLHSYATND